jgi:hypothetical protein
LLIRLLSFNLELCVKGGLSCVEGSLAWFFIKNSIARSISSPVMSVDASLLSIIGHKNCVPERGACSATEAVRNFTDWRS